MEKRLVVPEKQEVYQTQVGGFIEMCLILYRNAGWKIKLKGYSTPK